MLVAFETAVRRAARRTREGQMAWELVRSGYVDGEWQFRHADGGAALDVQKGRAGLKVLYQVTLYKVEPGAGPDDAPKFLEVYGVEDESHGPGVDNPPLDLYESVLTQHLGLRELLAAVVPPDPEPAPAPPLRPAKKVVYEDLAAKLPKGPPKKRTARR